MVCRKIKKTQDFWRGGNGTIAVDEVDENRLHENTGLSWHFYESEKKVENVGLLFHCSFLACKQRNGAHTYVYTMRKSTKARNEKTLGRNLVCCCSFLLTDSVHPNNQSHCFLHQSTQFHKQQANTDQSPLLKEIFSAHLMA